MVATPRRGCYRDSRGESLIRDWCGERIAAWAVPATLERFPAAGADTVALVSSGGPGTVVVLAGDRFCAAASLPLLETLTTRFRVVAADIPGQPGLSADRPIARSLAWYAEWLGDVLAWTGPALVLGHSFGGAVALACADPLMIGRLAVSPGGLCGLRLTPGVLLDFAAWIAQPGEHSSTRMLRRLLAGDAPPDRLVDWMTLVARHTRPISSDERVRPSSGTATTVASGADDVFFPPSRLRPAVLSTLGQPVHVIPNAGHLITEQAPEEIRDLALELATRG